jgi:CMP-N,N'-diacetyllegionaminic acid synthase
VSTAAGHRVIALIPARAGSRGIPGKNTRTLGGRSLVGWAVYCAAQSGVCDRIIVSTDDPTLLYGAGCGAEMLPRPSVLAGDDTPMLDVVRHAQQAIPGQPTDVWVLLQPTQPLRTPARVRQMAEALYGGYDSAVTVTELPKTHHPVFACAIDYVEDDSGEATVPLLRGYERQLYAPQGQTAPTRRQDAPPVYIRDGTAYAWWRRTVDTYGSLYGPRVRPMVVPADETLPLDTMADWNAAEARFAEAVEAR